MGRVATETMGIDYAFETTPGNVAADAVWKRQRRTSIDGSTGKTVNTITDESASPERQALQSELGTEETTAGLDCNVTLSAMDHLESLFFARAQRKQATDIQLSAASGTNYTATNTLRAKTSNPGDTLLLERDVLKAGQLIHVEGFVNPANNGLKVLGSDATASNISVAGLTADVPGQFGAWADCAGARKPSGTSVSWDYDANTGQASLTWTGHGLAAVGLQVGQWVCVGSPAAGSTPAVPVMQNAFTVPANSPTPDGANMGFGWVFVEAIATNSITFSAIPPRLQYDFTGVTGVIDILFSDELHNVSVEDPLYAEMTAQMEFRMPNLGTGSLAGQAKLFRCTGLLLNTMSMTMNVGEAASMTMGWIGKDTEYGIADADRRGANARASRMNGMYNMQRGFGRAQFIQADGAGLTTIFRNTSLSFTNNAEAEFALGDVGADEITPGRFVPTATTEIKLTDDAVLEAVSEGANFQWGFVLANQNGGMRWTFPSMQLGDGTFNFERNRSVKVNLSANIHGDNRLKRAGMVSFIRVPGLPRV